MTEQEKWETTERHMRMVSANYMLVLKGDNGRNRNFLRRQQLTRLRRWLSAIEVACERLRRREGKSSAKARHDWLVARTIEMTVHERVTDEELRAHLTGPRMLNRRFTEEMRAEGVRAVKAAAEEAGLLR